MIVLLAGLAAQAATNYGIKVAGVSVTSDNASNITGSNISGTVTYTHSTKTLLMRNVTINITSGSNRALLNTGCDGLTVRFEGTCTLYTSGKAPIRTETNTYLYAPSSSTVVNVTGVNEGAIFMAGDNHTLQIVGPGKFNIKTTKCPAIEGAEDSGQLQSGYFVEFYDVTAELYSPENALRRLYGVKFHESSHITFKATNNADYSIATSIQGFVFYGKEAVLAPVGAYASNSAGAFLDASGNRIKYDDVYISDNYAFIINSTNFPDANFRSAMLTLYPKGYLSQNDVNNCTYLNVASKSISNLKGIELLTELRNLHCNSNSLTSLDLRSNTKLTYVNCATNQLTSLYVQGLTNLESLYCGGNKLTSVSVNSFSSLKNLGCSNMTTLTSLYCNNCSLTNLNVTGCTALKQLQCHGNSNLAAITGLADCTAITYLDCESCVITNLDAVNNMGNIATLLARNNKLTSLTVTGKTKLADLRVGGNTLLTSLLCYGNALTTLNVSDCIALTNLRCYENPNLASIYGLASCTAITYLDCEDCAITSLDGVNNMSNLATLLARNNQLTTLTVTGKTQLATLRVSGNTSLTILECSNNALTSLNVTGCTALTKLYCTRNYNLSSITGLSDCTQLIYLFLYYCNFSSLNVSSLTKLQSLYCDNNKLTSLNVSALSQLITLCCWNNQLTTLNLYNKKSMTVLWCYGNKLTSLELSGCSMLEHIDCSDNQLTSLNLQDCVILHELYCYKNKIIGYHMTDMINSLRTIPSGYTGDLRVIYDTGENNSMTPDHIAAARAKNWIPMKWNGSEWEEMTAFRLGDVNEDGGIDVADVTTLISSILNGTPVNHNVADMNADDFIDITDVTLLITLILGN